MFFPNEKFAQYDMKQLINLRFFYSQCIDLAMVKECNAEIDARITHRAY